MEHLEQTNKARHAEKPFSYWLKKNWYYHTYLQRRYQFLINPGATILHIGCKNGYILFALKPASAVGVDINPSELQEAKIKLPHGKFFTTMQEVPPQTFEYIIISSVTLEIDDIQTFLEQLHSFCTPYTRLIIDTYSYLWEPFLALTQKAGLRRPTQFKNWLSHTDLHHILTLANFDLITTESLLLFPWHIPGISWFLNVCIAPLPGIKRLCINRLLIARPLHMPAHEHCSVSIIIPCRNEKGNIEAAVQRCPQLGSETEIIFVEGHSKDGTLAEIQRVQQAYPHKKISWFVQDGKDKGDAVRKGFLHARGDILMILDADLTMPPEDLPKFYAALTAGKGDFINGSRLVYGMEAGAMRFLNLIANYFFGVLFSWILQQPIKDTLCGTKALFKRDYERLVAQRSFFGDFDPFGDFDLLFGAAKLSLKIINIPIQYKSRVYGTTQIRRFYHGWILLSMSLLAMKKFKMR